jgi:energy-coupling factor transporter ATP-binding protein EcfA2
MAEIIFKPAQRERVPLLMAITGPTGSGKTYSALRLASGMSKVTGGKVALLDTESGRALHYAEEFAFDHFSLGAPFSSARYLAVIEAAVDAGYETLIVDSGSHEHEGPGGLLEAHDEEAKKLAKRYKSTVGKMQLSAWAAPKRERTKLINRILQLPINLIVCFRAKEKIKIRTGQDPVALGWMAIAGDAWVYEMSVNALLLPGARGVPTWESDEPGEKATIKLPGWAREIFPKGRPLDEQMGAAMASWAAGARMRTADEMVEGYARADDSAGFGSLERDRRAAWSGLSKADKSRVKKAADSARDRIEEPEPVEESDDDGLVSGDEADRMESDLDKAEADAMKQTEEEN